MNEIAILTAWEDWYSKSMQTVSDMDVESSKNLSSQIKAAQANLNALLKKQIELLR